MSIATNNGFFYPFARQRLRGLISTDWSRIFVSSLRWLLPCSSTRNDSVPHFSLFLNIHLHRHKFSPFVAVNLTWKIIRESRNLCSSRIIRFSFIKFPCLKQNFRVIVIISVAMSNFVPKYLNVDYAVRNRLYTKNSGPSLLRYDSQNASVLWAEARATAEARKMYISPNVQRVSSLRFVLLEIDRSLQARYVIRSMRKKCNWFRHNSFFAIIFRVKNKMRNSLFKIYFFNLHKIFLLLSRTILAYPPPSPNN